MMQSKMRKAMALSLRIALAGAAGCSQESDDFHIDQGIIVREFSGTGKLESWSLAQRTATISRSSIADQPDSERKGLGYTITAPSGADYFEIYSVSHLPGAPGKIGGSLTDNSSPNHGANEFKTSSQMFHEIGYEAFDLDESDPLGEYRIDVFVDGRFLDTVVFQVEP